LSSYPVPVATAYPASMAFLSVCTFVQSTYSLPSSDPQTIQSCYFPSHQELFHHSLWC
jgi:hypothetical protein